MKSTSLLNTSETDIKTPRLRIGLKDVSHEEFSAAIQEKLGKQRVSIMLDGDIIAYYKSKAGERGYQTLINQALHDAMQHEGIENMLRKVIREEFRTVQP